MTHTVNSTDGSYAGLSADSVTVTVTDPGTKGMTVTPTELTIDEGASSTYSVVLRTEPTANVTVTVDEGSSSIRVNPASLIFTTQNWSTPQTVTVAARIRR